MKTMRGQKDGMAMKQTTDAPIMPAVVRFDGEVSGHVANYKAIKSSGTGAMGGYFSTLNGLNIIPEKTHCRNEGPEGWSGWEARTKYWDNGEWSD